MRTFSGNLASPKGNPTRMFQPYKAISWGCCLCIRFQIRLWPDSKLWLCTTNTNTHKQRLVLHSPAGGLGFILGAPVLQCQTALVAIMDGRTMNPQPQRAHCAKVRVTDCCATHEYSPEKAFCTNCCHLWGGANFNGAQRCV